MPIHADVYTIDSREPVDIVFDAEPWFQSAQDYDINDLHLDQGEGDVSIEIVHWIASTNSKVAEFLEYCEQERCEFGCYVDIYEIEDWIAVNRPDLAEHLGLTDSDTDFIYNEQPQDTRYWNVGQPEPEEPEQPFTPSSPVLVIHPTDSSTAFLDLVYTGKGYDVLNSYKGNLNALLPHYQRIIMMGHGWTDGLFSVGQFRGYLAIDKTSVPGLQGKNNTYVWCMANTFTQKYGLKGFATGMFISEMREAQWFKIDTTPEIIEHSNMLFTNLIARIDQPTLEQVLKEYDGDDPIIQYNRKQMMI